MASRYFASVLICVTSLGCCAQSSAPEQQKGMPLILVLEKNMRGLKQPAGFVFNKGALCNNVVTPKSALSSLDSALYYAQKQGVKATLYGGVVNFDDGNNEEEQKELAFVIPRFAPPPATMNGLGLLLDGMVTMEMDKPRSFIGGFTGGQETQLRFPPQTNRTVRDNLDAIVKLDGKGMWVMTPPQKSTDGKGLSHRATIDIVDYETNTPPNAINCETAATEAERVSH